MFVVVVVIVIVVAVVAVVVNFHFLDWKHLFLIDLVQKFKTVS